MRTPPRGLPENNQGLQPEKRALNEEDKAIKEVFLGPIENNQQLTQDDITSKMLTNSRLRVPEIPVLSEEGGRLSQVLDKGGAWNRPQQSACRRPS